MRNRPFLALALATVAWAQTPAFEVASIKPSEPITPELVKSGRLQIGVTIDANYVRIKTFSLYDLTTLAYQVKPHQLSAPQWTTTARFDIQAKLPEGGKRGDVPVMLQALLAERFGLKIHRENRELRVYALSVAKNGPRLKPAEDQSAAAPPPGQLRGGVAVAPGGAMAAIAPGGDSRVTPGPNGALHMESKAITMARFADFINRYCDLPVVNDTALQGAFELAIDVSAEEARNAGRARGAMIPPAPADSASDPAGVSLMASLHKLGLRLEARKMPVEFIVVDQVEKVPTGN